MKAIHFVFCLCTAVVLSTFSSLAAGFQDISPEIHIQRFISVFTHQVPFEVSHYLAER